MESIQKTLMVLVAMCAVLLCAMCIYRGYQTSDTLCYVVGVSFGISAIIAVNTIKHI